MTVLSIQLFVMFREAIIGFTKIIFSFSQIDAVSGNRACTFSFTQLKFTKYSDFKLLRTKLI